MSEVQASPDGHELTALQQRTLAVLRRSGEPVVFDPEQIAALERDLLDAFEAFGDRLGDRTLYVNKFTVAGVLGCEVRHLAPDEFSWSPPVAGGQVAHKAIQLLVNWRGDPTPRELVDEAIEVLAGGDSQLSDWIAALDPAEEAELRGLAVERVTKFVECFPPLDRRATPMTEARVQWPLSGPIVLNGKVDLVLGRNVGGESRKVIIDLKTGRMNPVHREDLRFYALVEALRTGLPPRKVASFYLDAGQAHVEDVTPAVLRTAVRRTLDAIDVLIALTVEGRAPITRAGPACRWCPLLADCADGRAHLARVDEAD